MITAVFNDKMDYTIAYGLWQWDYGQVLRIKGLDFDQISIEVHFSLSPDNTNSLVTIGVVRDIDYQSTIVSDGEEYTVNETTTVLDVVIPKNMLWNNIKKNYTIYVFLLSTNEESGETLKRIIMPVKVKPKPLYSVTPEDEELFHRVVEEVNTFAETAKEHSNISKSYAVGNTGTRENEDIDNAKYYAEQSALSAEASEQSASNALVSENHALDSENSALGAESRARTYATEARDLKQEYDDTLALTKEYRDSAQASAISASANLRDTVTARNIATQASADANNFLNQTQAVYDLTVEIKQEVDETKADVDITKTEIDAVKTDIDATKADITATRTEIATTRAEVNTAKNEVIAIKSEVSDIKDATDEIKTDVISIANNINNSISEHNESTTAHSDIRNLISNLTNKLNTFLDTDDESLDQISELITFIQNNRTLIEGITTSKVDKNQGIENAYKSLIVGEDGYVTLGNIGGGSASYYPVEITLVDSTYQTDHTCQEISNAFKSGLIPYAFIHGVEQNIYHLMTCSEYLVGFVYLTEDNISIITISQNNTVTVNTDNPIIHTHQDISHKADKATTLSGYGITNAYTKGEVDNIINNLDTGVTSVNNKTGDVTITAQELGALTEHQDLSDYALKTDILEPLIGSADDITPEQVINAIEEGRDVCINKDYNFNGFPLNLKFTTWNKITDTVDGTFVFVISHIISNNDYCIFEIIGGVGTPWSISSITLATLDNLSSVASSGNYNDLTNKPTIPTVPTNVSAFTNDSGYINDLSPYIYYSQNSNTVYINSATETDADDVITINDRVTAVENDCYNSYAVDMASGAVASFMDGADDIPLKSLVVNIDPVQSGSGDPSPDNVRPITGWTGVNVKRMGVNLWDEEWESGTLNISTGEKVSSNVTMRSKNFIPVKPGMKCIAVGPYNVVNTNQLIICYYDKDEVYVGYRTLTRPESFEVPSDGRIALMRFAYRYYLNDSGGVYNHDVSVNYPSTATAYAPYSSTTYPISFPSSAGTVYGGHLDVLTGVLTVYPYYASYNGETLTGRWISDRDVYAVGTTPTIGAQVVNIGAEGAEIQLSPTEVKSLLGQNNIFADTGDSAVEYRADTKMYIERLTEPDADMIADANITSGSYFMVGNHLYKATANIASGGQVIEGTNAIRKSLSEALNEINA